MSAAAALLAAHLESMPDPAGGMSAVDVALFATVIGSILLFGGAAVLALGWSFRAGQFDNFQQGARSIFGPDEPIGEPTDAFPGAGAPRGTDGTDGAAANPRAAQAAIQ